MLKKDYVMEVELFNKAQWDVNVDKYAYKFYYWDNVKKLLIKIDWSDIIEYDKGVVLVHDMETGKDSNIPMHRFKKITYNDTIVFERKIPVIQGRHT